MRHRNVLLPLLAATAAGGLALTGAPAASAGAHHDRGPTVVGPYKHLVVIYEENHSFDNLYGALGTRRPPEGRRPAAAPKSTHGAARPGRHPVPLPAAERRQPHLARPVADHVLRDPAHDVPASAFRNTPCSHRRLHQADGHHLPAPGVFAANGVLKGTGRSRAAAPGTSCTASTRSSTSSTAAGRTGTSPAATPSG